MPQAILGLIWRSAVFVWQIDFYSDRQEDNMFL